MTKKFAVFFTILFVFGLTSYAQEGGYLNIHQTNEIKRLVEKHILINEYHPWVDGYRIQLYSVSGVNSRDKANTFKAQFLLKNPDAKVYIVYHAPYYKVRVGDFRTKLDALAYLQTIKRDFPSGFVVVDKIRFMEDDTEETNE